MSGDAIATIVAFAQGDAVNGLIHVGLYGREMTTDAGSIQNLAVLIDAENIPASVATRLFEEVSALGQATVRRIYGDFSGSRLSAWSSVLSAHAVIPHHVPANTSGKNASDIALVIDAIDLAHQGCVDAFCIVSSDGDFTRLALYLREHGRHVYGFGEEKTPASFRHACKRFILLGDGGRRTPDRSTQDDRVMAQQPLPPTDAVARIVPALKSLTQHDGWYSLGAVGLELAALTPAFACRQYGSAKLVQVVERSGAFDLRRDGLTVYIRPKAPTQP